jgi:hypothetical protein
MTIHGEKKIISGAKKAPYEMVKIMGCDVMNARMELVIFWMNEFANE